MNFIIYDLEATCWNGHQLGRRQEVIEIGAVKLNEVGEVLDYFEEYVKPVENPLLSAFCKELTNIAQENIDRAKKFDIISDNFVDWLGESYLLCSWGEKDIPLLRNDCIHFDLEDDWLKPNIDLKRQYHQIKFLKKKQGLAKTLSKEDIEFEGAHHRALNDAKNTAKLFVKYLDEWQF